MQNRPGREVFQRRIPASQEQGDLVFNTRHPLISFWRVHMDKSVVSKLRYTNSADPPVVRACIKGPWRAPILLCRDDPTGTKGARCALIPSYDVASAGSRFKLHMRDGL